LLRPNGGNRNGWAPKYAADAQIPRGDSGLGHDQVKLARLSRFEPKSR